MLSAVHHQINGKDLSWEEFRYNICLRYGLIPQDFPATFNGCGKKFLIDHALAFPKGGLVLARHDGAAKEWGALGARALVPIAITYKPKINSKTVQGERTGAEVQRESGTDKGSAEILVEAQQGGYIRKEAGTGKSTCRFEGRCKRPRLLEVGDHRVI